MVERNAGVPPGGRIEFRVGIHLGRRRRGERWRSDGRRHDIAARLEGVCKPGAVCLSEQAYWQVKGRLDLAVTDLGPTQLKNIAEPIQVYLFESRFPRRRSQRNRRTPRRPCRRKSVCGSPFSRRGDRGAADPDRGRRVVVHQREPTCRRRNECANTGRLKRASVACGPTSVHRRAAVRQSLAAIRRKITSPTL